MLKPPDAAGGRAGAAGAAVAECSVNFRLGFLAEVVLYNISSARRVRGLNESEHLGLWPCTRTTPHKMLIFRLLPVAAALISPSAKRQLHTICYDSAKPSEREVVFVPKNNVLPIYSTDAESRPSTKTSAQDDSRQWLAADEKKNVGVAATEWRAAAADAEAAEQVDGAAAADQESLAMVRSLFGRFSRGQELLRRNHGVPVLHQQAVLDQFIDYLNVACRVPAEMTELLSRMRQGRAAAREMGRPRTTRRRRDRDVDIPWVRSAATPWLRLGYSVGWRRRVAPTTRRARIAPTTRPWTGIAADHVSRRCFDEFRGRDVGRPLADDARVSLQGARVC